MKASEPPRAPGTTPIDASPAAQEAFLRLLEASPDDPLGLLPSLGLDASVAREVARIVEAYLRARRLESELAGPDGDVASALAALEAVEIPPVPREIPDRIGALEASRGAIYEVIEAISSGGRSAVVRARQREPIDREVAVKILFDDARDPSTGPAIAARAELERQILATLEHPNVARLYDSGIDRLGRPYFVMELVRGGRLTDWCRTSGRPLHERIRVYLGAVEAIRHAHSRGVLHRDLKPDNVLVQVIDGEPHCRVIDFGIALGLPGGREREALLREQGGLDARGFVGTLRSMSPEALDPSRPRLDVRSDVFGLGLVLFEVASGHGPRSDPRAGTDGAEDGVARTVAAAVEGRVPRLRDVDRAMPPELEAIVARACAPSPDDRYQSVAELHEDLVRFLRGDEVLAHPDGVARGALRLLRRRPVVALLSLGMLLATSAVLALRYDVDRRIDEAVARATGFLDEARAIREVAGTAPRRESLGLAAMDAAAGALGLRAGDADLLALRADAVEEVLLPRLARNDHRSPRTVELVEELVDLRERVVAARGRNPLALEQLSRSLAYQLDTTRGTPRFELVESRQLALDEELAHAHPSVLRFADNLCWTLQRASDHAWTRGDPARSVLLMRAAAERGDELVARDPGRAISHLTASMTSTLAASVALLDDDLDAALAAATTAVARAVEYVRQQPDSVSGAAQLLKAAALEGRILGELDRHLECGERLDAVIAAAAGPVRDELDRYLDGRPLAGVLALRFDAAIEVGDVEAARRALGELEIELDRDEALPTSARIRRTGPMDGAVRQARLLIVEGARDRAIEIALGLVASDGLGAGSDSGAPLLALIDRIEADAGSETPPALTSWRAAKRTSLAAVLAEAPGAGDGRACAEMARAAGALVQSLLSERRFEEASQTLDRLRSCAELSLDAALSMRGIERALGRAAGSLIPSVPAAGPSPRPPRRARSRAG